MTRMKYRSVPNGIPFFITGYTGLRVKNKNGKLTWYSNDSISHAACGLCEDVLVPEPHEMAMVKFLEKKIRRNYP